MLNYGVSVWGGALFRGVRGLGYDVVSPPGPNLLSGPTGQPVPRVHDFTVKPASPLTFYFPVKFV